MLHYPEVAYINSQKSVNYFEKLNDNKNLFYLREYFYSLINFADNCRYLCKYEESFKAISIAKTLMDKHDTLPQITCSNNYAIISVENHKIDLNVSLQTYFTPLLKDINEHIISDNTYTILFNNAACLSIMASNFELAAIYFEKALTILNNNIDNISNHVYFLKMNYGVYQYLSGNTETSIDILKEIKEKCTYKHSLQAHKNRHSLLINIFKTTSMSTYQELKDYMYKNRCFNNNKYNLPLSYNTPLLLWGMQYWSK